MDDMMIKQTKLKQKRSDLTDFERGQIVGARLAGASVTQTANILGITKSVVSRVFTQYIESDKTSSYKKNSGRKSKLSEKDRRVLKRIALAKTPAEATIKNVTNELNLHLRDPVCIHTVRRELRNAKINLLYVPSKLSKIVKSKPKTAQQLESTTTVIQAQDESLMVGGGGCSTTTIAKNPTTTTFISTMSNVRSLVNFQATAVSAAATNVDHNFVDNSDQHVGNQQQHINNNHQHQLATGKNETYSIPENVSIINHYQSSSPAATAAANMFCIALDNGFTGHHNHHYHHHFK